jgi:hypothetical protein
MIEGNRKNLHYPQPSPHQFAHVLAENFPKTAFLQPVDTIKHSSFSTRRAHSSVEEKGEKRNLHYGWSMRNLKLTNEPRVPSISSTNYLESIKTNTSHCGSFIYVFQVE